MNSLAALLGDVSVEIGAADGLAAERWRDALGFARAVYVSFVPHQTHHQSVAAAAALRRAGLVPVPHVPVRELASYTQLHDFLARLEGEAAVDEVLVIAGDAEHATGPFETTLQALATGLFERHGIRRVGVAGYPEGHPRIAAAALDQALRAKLALIRGAGMAARVVTQFCFEPAPILGFVRRLRAEAIEAPVRVGLAGPASVATLAKFAIRCGIGTSIAALVRGQTSITRILTQAGPDALVGALAAADPAALGIEGLHIYSFGGIAATASWLQAAPGRAEAVAS